jgi:NAD(P)H-dependent FMN reductase
MNPVKIVAFAGSLRKESFNHKLAEQIARYAAQEGAEVDVIRLADFDIPLFNEDVEKQGAIASIELLKDKIRNADALIVASPEYNGAISGVLKNALDWVSRTGKNQSPALPDTLVALVSSSPGGLGGIRGLASSREVFVGVGALLLNEQLAVGNAYQVFNEEGEIVDEQTLSKVKSLAKNLVGKALRLK